MGGGVSQREQSVVGLHSIIKSGSTKTVLDIRRD